MRARLEALLENLRVLKNEGVKDVFVSDEALAAGTGIRITGVKGAGATASTIFDGYVRMGMAYARA